MLLVRLGLGIGNEGKVGHGFPSWFDKNVNYLRGKN